ncbi:cilia- and flagella-associated protein 144 isoform X2 [Sminthopsis crassicaudata]|uniref:cilia- and flagella-associated protein 144 isoform X2 n=1 Tax=Sminthopsis crassicaudata TaxID=9301 RepID=UPI003D685758
MAARGREKAPADPVHQNQIMCELIRKELRAQKLYTEYNVNPHHPVHNITRKPMSWHDNVEEPADGKTPSLLKLVTQVAVVSWALPYPVPGELGAYKSVFRDVQEAPDWRGLALISGQIIQKLNFSRWGGGERRGNAQSRPSSLDFS